MEGRSCYTKRMQTTRTLSMQLRPEQQGKFLFLPFQMPDRVASLTLTYHYTRHAHHEIHVPAGVFSSQEEINIVDLGLIAPDGTQVGASGSDKSEFFVTATRATPGYTPYPLVPGEWKILVGAYKIAPEGCRVTYEITLEEKQLRLLKGDLHAHTLASDGVLTAAELGQRAVRHGLDFIAITDHNQMPRSAALPEIPGLTILPGMEWTHYQGHANFLGVDQPYEGTFATNTPAEALARFQSAHERGALITLNHPFEGDLGFQFDLNTFPYDCLEIWNGPMRESNLRAVAFWQSLLVAGKKIAISGGSDFHRDTPFLFPGGPTTCVYALSSSPADILTAVRQGHAYITFAPDGPSLALTAGDAILGDSVDWSTVRELHIRAEGLQAGDVLRVITAQAAEVLLQAPSAGAFEGDYVMRAPGFARIEILRAFLPGLSLLPALLSNPIYFDAA